MIGLTVSVDHVATVREARMGAEPDPVTIALMAETAGASGIALHLRSDRRHIQERDLRLLRELAKTSFDLQIGPGEESVGLALASRPDVVTLVQESKGSGSTGLDLVSIEDGIRETVQTLKRADVEISFFIEPDLGQVKTASRLGADRVEIRAHKYVSAFNSAEEEHELERMAAAATMGTKLGMAVYAGGSVDYKNVQKLVQIEELNGLVIGHAVVSRALAVGIDKAVGEILALVRSARAT
jgi:pyridoxine 5-phosphate synthase